MKLRRKAWVVMMVKSSVTVFFKSGLFIPTILLLLCLTTKACFKVEDEAACAGVRWFGLVDWPILLLFFVGFLVMAVREWIYA